MGNLACDGWRTSSFRWGGSNAINDPIRCGLKSGGTYFLKMTYVPLDSDNGTPPGQIEWGCDALFDEPYCGNIIDPNFSAP